MWVIGGGEWGQGICFSSKAESEENSLLLDGIYTYALCDLLTQDFAPPCRGSTQGLSPVRREDVRLLSNATFYLKCCTELS